MESIGGGVPVGGGMQDPGMRSLSRQGSLYGLTLDEVHHQIGNGGRPLGSMNLDELLKSIWSADATTNQASDAGKGIENPRGRNGQGSQLQKQPSFLLSQSLGEKTVDEVWKNIQQGKSKGEVAVADDGQEGANRDRQPTLGEITLEEFLSLAGVMAGQPEATKADPITGVLPAAAAQQDNNLQAEQWMHYRLASVQQQQNVAPLFIPANHTVQPPISVASTAASFLDTGFPDAQIALSPSSFLGAVSDAQFPGRKRVAPEGVIEKTVERRQKRMIKNRESAARSRARKQAYTEELENKVAYLEEENAKLRKQRDLDKALPPPTEPKKKLRRTSSAPAPL